MVRLLLAAIAVLSPFARGAERVEPVNAEAPLSPATPVLAPTPAAPAGSFELPASALPADGPRVSIAAPAASAQAWTQASPQAYAAAPNAQGRAVAAAPKPYFAAALEKAGVKPELADMLQKYLDAPGRHPGPQALAYHGRHHTYDVAALAARLTESPEAGKLSREQKALLILSAALHDVDPRRAPLTPASVDRTLQYIDDDPSTRQLVGRFADEYGFTAGQVKALIKATDFSTDPKRAAELVDETKAMLAKEFRDGDWAATWSRRLAFADKMASYVGDPAYADRQVRGLANEIKLNSMTLAEGSAAFLGPLRRSPDYALLPAELKTNFERVYAHFEDVALHPQQYEKDFPPARGPPETDARRFAREAAAAPVGAELDAQLARLEKTGLTFLSAPGAVDPAAARAVLESVAGDKASTEYELFEKPGEGQRRSLPDYDGWKDARGGPARALVARLEYLLNRALPNEKLVAAKAGLRVEYARDDRGVPAPHVDSRWLTITLALEGPGTDVWDDASGKVEHERAPAGVVVAQTAVDRAIKLGVPGTVHATPTGWSGRRVLLVVNFESQGYERPALDAASKYQQSRAAAVMRRFTAKGGKPAHKGLFAQLKGIFE